jgi:crotonobetainyl-CoA:carnitine CoA-transferase CaiB-like acyl-CoA transferase
LITEQALSEGGKQHVMAPPYRLDGERLPIRHAPPVLGEGTHEVLTHLLGLTADDLAALKAKGVI